MSGTAVAKPRQVKWAERQLEYCRRQIDRTLTELPNDSALPRSIDIDKNKWLTTTPYDWTSGFWPGILWYNYENSDKLTDKLQALAYTERQRPLVDKKHVPDHQTGSPVQPESRDHTVMAPRREGQRLAAQHHHGQHDEPAAPVLRRQQRRLA